MAPLQATSRSSAVIGRRHVGRVPADTGTPSAASGENPAEAATAALAALPDITIGEIAAYVALLQCGSFTGAAKRLYLSQPGLSARIARLERALGAVLIERSTRELTLTRAGAAFAVTAHSVLRLLEPASQVSTGGEQLGAPSTMSRPCRTSRSAGRPSSNQLDWGYPPTSCGPATEG